MCARFPNREQPLTCTSLQAPTTFCFVALPDRDALRVFVLDQLKARTEVALTEASLVFEYISGATDRRA